MKFTPIPNSLAPFGMIITLLQAMLSFDPMQSMKPFASFSSLCQMKPFINGS